MKKYLSIFRISLEQEFAYRINFVMWRVRNVIQIFIVFFLWDTIFSDSSRVVFGYDRAKILTYIFGLLIVKAFVLSARGVDVAGEIADGRLTNYLLKPISYFKYWLARDLSSKTLNLIFATLEASLLFLLLKPPFFLQTDPLLIFGFLVAVALAVFLFFTALFITSFVPFWYPEIAWGAQFLFMFIFTEFLSGAIFPLDILPLPIQNALYLTPFPYLIFFPLQIYLGKISFPLMLKGLMVGVFWSAVLWFSMRSLWTKGLKAYRAEGR